MEFLYQVVRSCKVSTPVYLDNLQDLNSFPTCKDSSIAKCEFSVAGDASDRGFFVYKVESKQRLYSRPSTVAESKESSTFKELTAVHESWKNVDILKELAGKTVGHYGDM